VQGLEGKSIEQSHSGSHIAPDKSAQPRAVPKGTVTVRHNRKPKFRHHHTRHIRRAATPLLSPSLIEALKGLAAVEELPLPTLIAVRINEALDRRLQRARS
jgi:hypothetical protein